MNTAAGLAPWSTVSVVPDYLLLSQTRQLARHEQALQILVLDHLREIEARSLHLTRGYRSLFEFVVRELDYTAAAAWRRIKAMRLCSATSGARELLQDGSLNLSNAAQLQNLFERSDRNHDLPPVSHASGAGLGRAPQNSDAPGTPASANPMRAGERDSAPVRGPVLDAAAREKLVKQAAGKSTREVQLMLAEVDPELAQPNDRMRAIGNGRWELKAAVDAECRHGLEKLQMLLSHRDPHLTLGALVARLVRDGLDRYDPERPRRARRTGGRGSGSGDRYASPSARRDAEAVRDGTSGPSASKRQTEAEHRSTKSDPVGEFALSSASAPKRPSNAEHGSASPGAVPNGGGHNITPAKRQSIPELSRPARMVKRAGGRAASPAKRQGRADGRGAARPHFEAGERNASREPVRARNRFTSSVARRLAHAARYGPAGPAERSPALERHLAALSCFRELPGSRSRYIPADVRREAWRRDQGCCSYVNRHSGRRCSSRYRLEIDHIVPFALGGATELFNVRLRCRAHHKLRHAQAPRPPARLPTEAGRAPVSAVDPVECGQTCESNDASRRDGARSRRGGTACRPAP